MSQLNTDLAEGFTEMADLLEIESANPFRVRAYRNAARLLPTLSRGVDVMLADGEDLTRLPGIGDDLARKIAEFVETGHLKALDRLKHDLPEHLTDLLQVHGLGPKRVHALYHELGIDNLQSLRQAAEAHRLQSLPGFGAKTEKAILRALAEVRPRHRWPCSEAKPSAERLCRFLEDMEGVDRVVVAGSYRRQAPTVGDLDILVTAERGRPVMQRLRDYAAVDQVVSSGDTRTTVILDSGLQVDVRVVPQASFGAALVYFTGSKTFNIALRYLAGRQGLKINEYGVFRGDQRIAGRTEKEVLAAVGLPWIAPEERESSESIRKVTDQTHDH